jgi:hypothetical protein
LELLISVIDSQALGLGQWRVQDCSPQKNFSWVTMIPRWVEQKNLQQLIDNIIISDTYVCIYVHMIYIKYIYWERAKRERELAGSLLLC